MRRVINKFMYPRYHSNCVPRDAPSGSGKPYALTRQSREASTYPAGAFGPPAQKGWDIEGVCCRGSTTPGSLETCAASSVFVIAFLFTSRPVYTTAGNLSRFFSTSGFFSRVFSVHRPSAQAHQLLQPQPGHSIRRHSPVASGAEGHGPHLGPIRHTRALELLGKEAAVETFEPL